MNKISKKFEKEITIQDVRDELYKYNSFLARKEREIKNLKKLER